MAQRRIARKPERGRGLERLADAADLGRRAIDLDRPAVDAYLELSRGAPRTRIELAQVAAFEELSPEQLDLLLRRFLHSPASDDPRSPVGPTIGRASERGGRILALLHHPSAGILLSGLALLGASGVIAGSGFPAAVALDRAEGRDQSRGARQDLIDNSGFSDPHPPQLSTKEQK